MKDFGQVRNVSNRMPDLGYFMASGQRSRAEIQADINDLTNKLAENESALTTASRRLTDAKNKKEGGYCANKYSLKSRKETCQREVNQQYSDALSTFNNLKSLVNSQKENLDLLQEELTTANAVALNLSEQGLTEEAVLTQAQADAQATIEQAQADARSKESGKKTRNIVIALIVVAVVVVGTIYMIRKIRSKKKSK